MGFNNYKKFKQLKIGQRFYHKYTYYWRNWAGYFHEEKYGIFKKYDKVCAYEEDDYTFIDMLDGDEYVRMVE